MRAERLSSAFLAFKIVILTVVMLELCSAAFYYWWSGEAFSYARVRQQQELVVQSSNIDLTKGEPAWQLHPYLGYTSAPTSSTGFYFLPDKRYQVNDYGFISTGGDFIVQDPDIFNIAITGASVAMQATFRSDEVLLSRLKKIPALHHVKQFKITSLGIQSSHQPQQLMAVIYYLMLGGRIDMVINLDGYSDIEHPVSLYYKKMYPFYPLHWHDSKLKNASPALIEASYALLQSKRFEVQLAKLCRRVPFSVTSGVIWAVLDRHSKHEISELQNKISGPETAKSRVLTGPPLDKKITNGALLYQPIKDVWLNSSLHMRAVAQEHKAVYFHFLQPNQYTRNHKILSAEEIKAINGLNPRYITIGYEFLRKGVVQLQEAGVNAYDLTDVYKDFAGTAYMDDCCHVNKVGSDMLMDAMADKIEAYYAAQKETAKPH